MVDEFSPGIPNRTITLTASTSGSNNPERTTMNSQLRSAAPRALFLAALAFLILGAILVGFQATTGASSHREAPLISRDPSVDNTDVYAFVSPDDPSTVTLISNWIPFEEPAGGPNFYHLDEADLARYWIKIDNTGDGVCDIGFLFTFHTAIQNSKTFLYNTGPISSLTDPNFNYRQTYDVTRYDGSPCESGATTALASSKTQPPDNVGKRSTSPYAPLANGGIYPLTGGGKVFVGQRDDPFFVDIGSIFDLGGLRPFNPAHLIPLPKATGIDNIGGYNIHTTALQLPKSALVNAACNNTPGNAKCVIGVWSTAERAQTITRTGGAEAGSGGWIQVSRLGNPLVNEAVLPLALKDAFNSLDPSQDFALYTSNTPAGNLLKSSVLTPELGTLIPVLYPGVTVPPPPRNDIQEVFLQGIPGLNEMSAGYTPAEYLRLNTAIAPTAGVCQGKRMGALAGDNAGFPNGRRLEDDVTDAALRVIAGGYVLTPSFNHAPNNKLADGVDHNDRKCLASFPYMANPWSGYRSSHGTPATTAPLSATSDEQQ
jgi:hypothetical protein